MMKNLRSSLKASFKYWTMIKLVDPRRTWMINVKAFEVRTGMTRMNLQPMIKKLTS